MARRRFPLVDTLIGTPAGGGVLGQPALLTHGLVVNLYADEACTVALDARTLDGATPITSTSVNGASILPFLGPADGTRVVYGRQQGGTGPGFMLVAVDGAQDPTTGGGGYTGYVHTQSTPAAQWQVNHNLGRRPQPVVILNGDGGRSCLPDIIYSDNSTLLLDFPAAVAGVAEL